MVTLKSSYHTWPMRWSSTSAHAPTGTAWTVIATLRPARRAPTGPIWDAPASLRRTRSVTLGGLAPPRRANCSSMLSNGFWKNARTLASLPAAWPAKPGSLTGRSIGTSAASDPYCRRPLNACAMNSRGSCPTSNRPMGQRPSNGPACERGYAPSFPRLENTGRSCVPISTPSKAMRHCASGATTVSASACRAYRVT